MRIVPTSEIWKSCFKPRTAVAEAQLAATQSNVNSSATGSRSRLAILSKVSNEGALTPRSIRLRKSTEMSRVSANLS